MCRQSEPGLTIADLAAELPNTALRRTITVTSLPELEAMGVRVVPSLGPGGGKFHFTVEVPDPLPNPMADVLSKLFDAGKQPCWFR